MNGRKGGRRTGGRADRLTGGLSVGRADGIAGGPDGGWTDLRAQVCGGKTGGLTTNAARGVAGVLGAYARTRGIAGERAGGRAGGRAVLVGKRVYGRH